MATGGSSGGGKLAYRPRPGNIFIDKLTGTKYILEKVIGTCDFHFIYKASYYTAESTIEGRLLPTGYATVKFIEPGYDFYKSKAAEQLVRNSNMIHVERWRIQKFRHGYCVAFPYMSEGSLRYILSTRFQNGLPEDCIAIALKEALLGLFDLHFSGRVHKRFSAGSIYVSFKPRSVLNVEIKLGYATTIYESALETPTVLKRGPETGNQPYLGLKGKNLGGPPILDLSFLPDWAAAPEIFHLNFYDSDNENRNPARSSSRSEIDENYSVKSDIWLVGIAALELAYGNLRISHREELEGLIRKIERSRRLPNKLEDVLEEYHEEEKKGKTKKVMGYLKDKMKLVKYNRMNKFSKEFEELVLDCLSTKESKRPSVGGLLHRPFFRNAKNLQWFQRRVLYAKDPMPYY
uniref:Protein kinase domain-containing protein n=1 Tax=Solanum lycopersicum TaxID=4081 RepID=K4C180_SOLLC|nr:serine/threonine-protein kinase BLUS1-like [Solanum lycopersicum]